MTNTNYPPDGFLLLVVTNKDGLFLSSPIISSF